jgi:hypothetical protein
MTRYYARLFIFPFRTPFFMWVQGQGQRHLEMDSASLPRSSLSLSLSNRIRGCNEHLVLNFTLVGITNRRFPRRSSDRFRFPPRDSSRRRLFSLSSFLSLFLSLRADANLTRAPVLPSPPSQPPASLFSPPNPCELLPSSSISPLLQKAHKTEAFYTCI